LSIYPDGSYEVSLSNNPSLKSSLELYDSYLDTLKGYVDACRGSSDEETIYNMSKFIMDMITYNVDEAYEYPLAAMQTGYGRCSTYSLLLNDLCKIAGYKSESIFCDIKGSTSLHALNRVWYGDRWHYIDLTMIDSNGGNRYNYYDMDYNLLFQYYTLYSKSYHAV
jgi:hypothetical protein